MVKLVRNAFEKAVPDAHWAGIDCSMAVPAEPTFSLLVSGPLRRSMPASSMASSLKRLWGNAV